MTDLKSLDALLWRLAAMWRRYPAHEGDRNRPIHNAVAAALYARAIAAAGVPA